MAIALPLVVCAVGVLIALAARTPPGPDSAWLIWPTGSSGFESPPSSSAGTSSSLASLPISQPSWPQGPGEWWPTTAPERGLERWLEDANAPQAYRSADGAIVMADRVWGGNVECEPTVSVC